jgi:serine phosphatase RsbU (regulator of sigma subunit)
MIGAGAPLVVDDAQADERVRDLGAVRSLGMGACLTYPIRDGDGEIVGGLSVTTDDRRAWTGAQLRAMETLARGVSAEVQLRGALAALQSEADGFQLARDRYATLARSLQQGLLLPPTLPAIPGLDAAAAYLPAGHGVEVVGDFYDLFPVGPDAWVVIGDVCGHGVEAAKLTAPARYTVRSQATEPGATPARVLTRLNDAMTAQEVDRFLTAAIARIRPASGGWVGTLSSAGHEPPLVRRAVRRRDAAGIVDEVMQAVERHSGGYRADDTAVLVLRSP